MTAQLNATRPIVGPDGTMEQPFRTWANDVTLSLPILGTGSPEGIVAAPQYSLYIDRAGLAGSIQYRKMLPEIAGDVKKGWLLA